MPSVDPICSPAAAFAANSAAATAASTARAATSGASAPGTVCSDAGSPAAAESSADGADSPGSEPSPAASIEAAPSGTSSLPPPSLGAETSTAGTLASGAGAPPSAGASPSPWPSPCACGSGTAEAAASPPGAGDWAGGSAGRWARRIREASRRTIPGNSVMVFMMVAAVRRHACSSGRCPPLLVGAATFVNRAEVTAARLQQGLALSAPYRGGHRFLVAQTL